ncbi:PH domain-containing protein [Propioniciclava flava]
MALPRKLLGADEKVVLHLRTHRKALIVPVLCGIALVVAVIVVFAITIPSLRPWVDRGTFAVAMILFIVMTLVPYLRWLTLTYTITDRRVITRHGIFRTTGHDLPLTRINNVTYDRSLLDRILGCGTLQFTTAAEAPVTLPDVPDVERVHVIMTELLFGDEQGERRRPESRD